MVTKYCPFCHTGINSSLVHHIRVEHGEEVLRKAVLADKQSGVSDTQIGEKYGISFSYLEKVITQEYGANISSMVRKRTKIILWEPKGYKPEATTIWSFKNRGNWATHDGRYRGNWSPYIPRNVILRYTQPGDAILDYFSGGGTTAVESKLLGRRCIARDINPDALTLTRENIDFQIPLNMFSGNGMNYQPELVLGDARDLSSIGDETIDLICAHPPYAGIINYSADLVEGDLSRLSVSEFITEMHKVAQESYRVLKPGRKCAILIGDSRKSKHIVPIAFQTIRAFLNAGFLLRELVIKRQHNCKTTGFWYSNSIRYNFLLLAHEFLPIFEKPETTKTICESKQLTWFTDFQIRQTTQEIARVEKEQLETTSVWIFPSNKLGEEIRRNLLGRFSQEGETILEYEWGQITHPANPTAHQKLVFMHCPPDSVLTADFDVQHYLELLSQATSEAKKHLAQNGFCVIEVRDYRRNGYIVPLGLLAYEQLAKTELEIREIVIVTSEENKLFDEPSADKLGIAHKYLLIYRKP
ncbi:MAG: DNA methyltransferase [Anaerolineales bacterium]|nr:DNA methyltransferase [Anaerolineales bacterium]